MRHRGWLLIALAALIGGGGGLLAREAGLRLVHITSTSMAPTVKKGDWIVVGSVGDRGLRRGDIVEFSFPIGTSGRAIKRVVAVAGDRVEFTDDTVTVNGHERPIGGTPRPGRGGSFTVREGSVFLLGDHAEVSIDSRAFGPVPVIEIVARERVVVPRWSLLTLAALAVLALGYTLRRNRGRLRGRGGRASVACVA